MGMGKNLILHISNYTRAHRALFIISLTLFFIRIFDGILAYAVPLLVIEQGFSRTQMGMIIGFSSLAGATFDIVLSHVLTKVSYKRLFLFLFVTCLFYALTLWGAQTLLVFLLAMAMWGIYFDFMSFATFDFVARELPKDEHSAGFGVLDIFKSLGYLLAPLLSGLVIIDRVNDRTFIFALIFLAIGAIFFLLIATDKNREVDLKHKRIRKPLSIFQEMQQWRQLSKFLFPVLFMTLVMNFSDAFFWTIGPLISENLSQIHPFGGLLITLYFLPSLLVGWFVGSITKRFGKKRTAIVCFFCGSLILTSSAFVGLSPLLLIVVLLSSLVSAVAWPAMNGAYADYIEETPRIEAQIEGVNDFAYNIAYVIGPILAGFMSDRVGDLTALSLTGVVGVISSVILLKITPRHIRLRAQV